MGLWFIQCACCFKMTLLYWCICPHVIYLCIIKMVFFFIKMSLKLYLFIIVCNVDAWFVFVKNIILKSSIITIRQCEGIFCIMLSNLKLQCDTHILGGLYIAITYNFSCVLSLKSAVINLAPKFVIVVFSINDTLSS